MFNVNKVFENACSQLKGFKESLPEGFRSTIKNLVVPIGSKTKRKTKLQLKKITTLSCCLYVLFIYSVLVKLNLKVYLILN